MIGNHTRDGSQASQRDQRIDQRAAPAQVVVAAAVLGVVDGVALCAQDGAHMAVGDQLAWPAIRRLANFEQPHVEIETQRYGFGVGVAWSVF
jgi:hypothetical protein